MASFEDASQNFLTWLTKCGAEISPKISLQDLREEHAGRGVVATQDIAEDELLFRIPRSAILCVENSILSTELPKTTFDSLGPWLSLILVMLYEYQNHGASNWSPYFDVLPTDFNTLMFWSEDELAHLQASAVVSKIGRAGADASFANDLVPVIREFADVFFSGDMHADEKAAAMSSPENMQLMHKMGSLIMAYAFDVEPAVPPTRAVDEDGYASEDEDEALPKGMVPLADMLNADADRNNARLFYEESSLSMKALAPIPAGDQIFNDYGALPRSDLLRRYGYITDNYAPYDVVEIPHALVLDTITTTAISPQLTPSAAEEREAYLSEHPGLTESGYDITRLDPSTPLAESLPELTLLTKTLLLPASEFARLASKGKLPRLEVADAQHAKLLLEIVRRRKAQYATTLEQDLSNPPAGGEGERRREQAWRVRVGEKEILRDVEAALEGVVKGFDDAAAATGEKRSGEEVENDGEEGKRRRVR
ncbi:SET domain-containing protein [Aaosphaeria arxii CBS 175.79]|uniref:SET domain-containing protein n=1 Tax=Aaosphaeria arxii CBS 175.79 TaxID=1450172 RepID=A0A6A5XH92_9PLEO|nr:SET domain-containing protein [Aaosphaeria arxii CBS 175.79]KAF2012578.1 SET domain-containing protein [Aaosphaeria arxii CBS 175.79]